ncbi:hypothetical protein [Vibrio phage JSF12]|uniref:Uncharacterized protein n=2 Tax=Jesfedecavirus TaxID=2560156 RepID=A0A2D0YLX1_9CAUD|nr:terminase small subunit [Vibrio phage JSF10]YP_009794784.1 terminase small subunit [Vibrio phage JSF12]ASV43480.1 hypothetical protein [Vibrio phage JSF10]ASV43619.1 hypothetical protein [Vibrio phage JSF12]
MSDNLLPDIIAPEGLRIAETYLSLGGDTKKVASELGLPVAEIDAQLKKPEVKSYINRMFYETGFRNRDRLFGLMDQLINMKIDEITASGVGTSADILELAKAYHRMKMDEMKLEVELEKARAAKGSPSNQTNVQNNINIVGSEDSNYMALLQKLAGGR